MNLAIPLSAPAMKSRASTKASTTASVPMSPACPSNDYNTDEYLNGLTSLPACPTGDREVEYFPHSRRQLQLSPRWNAVLYLQPAPDPSCLRRQNLHEYARTPITTTPSSAVAPSKASCTSTATKAPVPIITTSASKTAPSAAPIITDTPKVLKWRENCLYFTGSATFQNTAMAEATHPRAPL